MTSEKLLADYIESISFEERKVEDVTDAQVRALGTKEGIVIDTDSTGLWILRSIVVMDVLRVPTVMESAQEYMIIDNFGMQLWRGSAKEVVEYAQGFAGILE